MRLLVLVTVLGCSDGAPVMPDAPSAPTVTVRSPNGGETYYPTATVSVQWIATGTGELVGLVEAFDGTTATTIASGVTATSGAMITTPWVLAGIPDRTTYQIRVSITDGMGAMAADLSNASFTVRTAQAVSFASQIQPMFTASCTSSSCHDNSQPAAGLELTTGNSFGELVGIASMQCAANKLVDAGKPEASYLAFKLDGAGPCFVGNAMPLGTTLVPAQILTVRDWIANGAQNN